MATIKDGVKLIEAEKSHWNTTSHWKFTLVIRP